MLDLVQPGSMDPMFLLKKKADADDAKIKVNLGVGIYRNEDGKYQELEVERQAKKTLDRLDLGHNVSRSPLLNMKLDADGELLKYTPTTRDREFLLLAADILFGIRREALLSGRITSVETISGTGANSLGASLISQTFPSKHVYVPVPTWGNHVPIFQNVGLGPITFAYLDASNHVPDMEVILGTARTAPSESVFVLQGCCCIPTGLDLDHAQWRQLAVEMKARSHLAFVEISYQGLGDGLEEDATGVRIMVKAGLEMLVCQSFSNIFALYGERWGALHVVARNEVVGANVQDRLRSLIRCKYSFLAYVRKPAGQTRLEQR